MNFRRDSKELQESFKKASRELLESANEHNNAKENKRGRSLLGGVHYVL